MSLKERKKLAHQGLLTICTYDYKLYNNNKVLKLFDRGQYNQ